MFSPANVFPYRRKLSETGRNKIETTSKQPTTKNTTVKRTFKAPEVSPFGAKSSLRNPSGPTSRKAQTIQRAKKTSAIARVKFRSALAPRNKGESTLKPAAVQCPQPIVPTPGMRPNQFAERMNTKMVAKN